MSNTQLRIKIINSSLIDFYKDNNHFHEGDSGIDLYNPEEIVIKPGDTKLIDLGIQCEMLKIELQKPMYQLNDSNTIENTEYTKENISYYLYPRSSISKTPLMMANSVGIIDSGYRGNIMASVRYISDGSECQDKYIIKKNSRLFQICGPNLEKLNYKVVNELSNTSRGIGGFGSTGI